MRVLSAISLQQAVCRPATLFKPTISRASSRARMSVSVNASAADWAKQDERRMLHAVYRVGNMDEYIKYMKDCFGMQLLRYRDIPDEKYTNAFLGFGPETTNFAIEYVFSIIL
jgi:lactoylglutathione lyase